MRGDSMNDHEQKENSRMFSTLIDAVPPVLAQTAGAWLREARQQRGLHIAALAAMLKVPQAKLEALEANRFQDLPDATFARALAKAMCRVLKVDSAPVMGLLPPAGERSLDVSRGLNQPYRERGGRDEGLTLAWLQRPIVWLAGLLLLAAAGVYLMPTDWLARTPGLDAAAVSATAAVNPPEPVAASAPMVAEPLLQAPASAVASVASVASVVAVTTAANEALAQAVPAPAGSIPIKLKVTADSWVEIVDARGQVLISRLLKSGDATELAGLPPLKVKVGNVSATELNLRGSKVDLAAQSKDNVARIELN